MSDEVSLESNHSKQYELSRPMTPSEKADFTIRSIFQDGDRFAINSITPHGVIEPDEEVKGFISERELTIEVHDIDKL